jgi:structure-specific recognition protein 1
LGWKPTGGQTFTLDKAELISAQWSRAAKAHELKIYARHAGVVQLDGFKQEVSGAILMTSLGGGRMY